MTSIKHQVSCNQQPLVIHIVISLDPGGLERMVVNLTNARNKLSPGSTFVCCLDHLGALAADVEEDAVFCVNADRSRFPWDNSAVQQLKCRAAELLSCYVDKLSGVEDEINTNNPQQPRNPTTQQPQIVCHAHNLSPWQYAVLAARGTDIKVIYTQHGPNPHHWGIKDKIRCGYLAGKTEAITAVSDHTAKMMAEKQGIQRDRIEIIHNGIPDNSTTEQLNNNAEFRKKHRISKDAFVVGSVGRFSPEKNYPLLVKAFSMFLKSNTPTLQHSNSYTPTPPHPTTPSSSPVLPLSHSPFLLLIGDGPDRSHIEQIIKECGVEDNCRLPGMQDNVAEWLDAMDVFCLSSDSEGISISLLEAQRAGLPAVVTDVGGNGEIVVDSVNGFLVEQGDEGAIAGALMQLASDEEMRIRMGEEASRIANDKFSLEKVLKGYEKIYEHVVIQG